MAMICKKLEKGNEKIHVKVKLFIDGLDHLESSDDIHQPSNSYTTRLRRANDREKFEYVDLISYALTIVEEIAN